MELNRFIVFSGFSFHLQLQLNIIDSKIHFEHFICQGISIKRFLSSLVQQPYFRKCWNVKWGGLFSRPDKPLFSILCTAHWMISPIFPLSLSACKTLLNKKSDGVKVSSLSYEGFIDFAVSVLLLLSSVVSLLVRHPNDSLLTCIFDIISFWKSCTFFKLDYFYAQGLPLSVFLTFIKCN